MLHLLNFYPELIIICNIIQFVYLFIVYNILVSVLSLILEHCLEQTRRGAQ